MLHYGWGMQKKFTVLVSVVVLAVALSACGKSESSESGGAETKNSALAGSAAGRITITAQRDGATSVSCSYEVGAATFCTLPRLNVDGWKFGVSVLIGAENQTVEASTSGGGSVGSPAPSTIATTASPVTTTTSPGNRDDCWPYPDPAAPTVNYSGQSLVGRDFRGQNLAGANFAVADLTRANFSGANLTHANLQMARLTDANLFRANLTCARVSGSFLIRTNLEEAQLASADLSNTDLTNANLRRARINVLDANRGINGTRFTAANVQGALFPPFFTLEFCRAVDADNCNLRRNHR